MKRIVTFILATFASMASYFFPEAVVTIQPGIVPDNMGMWGLFGFMANVNAFSDNLVSVGTASSTSTSITAPAAAIAGGIMPIVGNPGGGIAVTTDTAANIITALGSTIPKNGTFQKIVRVINALTSSETITWTAGSGVTVTGTATVATTVWRDYVLTVTSPTTVTFTNIGAGTV